MKISEIKPQVYEMAERAEELRYTSRRGVLLFAAIPAPPSPDIFIQGTL